MCVVFKSWHCSRILLVLFHVALEDVIKGSEQAIESGTVEAEGLAVAGCHDGGGAEIIR